VACGLLAGGGGASTPPAKMRYRYLLSGVRKCEEKREKERQRFTRLGKVDHELGGETCNSIELPGWGEIEVDWGPMVWAQ